MRENPLRKAINEANITVSHAVTDLANIERQLKEASPVPLPELPLLSDALNKLTEVSKQLWVRVGMPPEVFRETTVSPKSATYMTSNPPNIIKVRGQDYHIHMTFIKRSDAEEEARDLRDHGYRTHIEPWSPGYALYEASRPSY